MIINLGKGYGFKSENTCFYDWLVTVKLNIIMVKFLPINLANICWFEIHSRISNLDVSTTFGHSILYVIELV